MPEEHSVVGSTPTSSILNLVIKIQVYMLVSFVFVQENKHYNNTSIFNFSFRGINRKEDKGMATYVIGDIHGCYNEWVELKDRIESEDSDAKFILVGDIVDRGPQVFDMIQWAMKNITTDGKYQMILGNHEDEKIEWWDYCVAPLIKRNKECGIMTTIDMLPRDRYNFLTVMDNMNFNLKDIEEIINWFKALPLYKDIKVDNKRFIIVHANIPLSAIDINDENSITKDISDATRSFMLWDREAGDFNKIKGATLVHGHTPSVFPEAFPIGHKINDSDIGRIVKCKNRFNIDCGLVYKEYYSQCNLAALRLEDSKEIYLYN